MKFIEKDLSTLLESIEHDIGDIRDFLVPLEAIKIIVNDSWAKVQSDLGIVLANNKDWISQATHSMNTLTLKLGNRQCKNLVNDFIPAMEKLLHADKELIARTSSFQNHERETRALVSQLEAASNDVTFLTASSLAAEHQIVFEKAAFQHQVAVDKMNSNYAQHSTARWIAGAVLSAAKPQEVMDAEREEKAASKLVEAARKEYNTASNTLQECVDTLNIPSLKERLAAREEALEHEKLDKVLKRAQRNHVDSQSDCQKTSANKYYFAYGFLRKYKKV